MFGTVHNRDLMIRNFAIGLCCVYGNGKMSISANGETLVETGDEDFKTQEYPFELFSNGNITPDSTTSSTTLCGG